MPSARAPGKPNTSREWENPKWKSFFDGRPARGGEYCRDIFRPTEECMMKSIEFRLCPVCKRAFETFFAARTDAAVRMRPECQHRGDRSDAGMSGVPCNLLAEGTCGKGSTCSWAGADYRCKPDMRSGTGRACTRDTDCPSGNICPRNDNDGGGFACEPRGRAACQ